MVFTAEVLANGRIAVCRSVPMRIGLVTRRFDAAGGGTERDLLVTARILAAAGHHISIFADEVRTRSEEFKVHRVGRVRLRGAVGLWLFATRAASQARRGGAELVLSFARILGAAPSARTDGRIADETLKRGGHVANALDGVGMERRFEVVGHE